MCGTTGERNSVRSTRSPTPACEPRSFEEESRGAVRIGADNEELIPANVLGTELIGWFAEVGSTYSIKPAVDTMTLWRRAVSINSLTARRGIRVKEPPAKFSESWYRTNVSTTSSRSRLPLLRFAEHFDRLPVLSDYLTFTLTSPLVQQQTKSPPSGPDESFATTRSMYSPGSLKVAMVAALPLKTFFMGI
jgi:hypothetical protein